MCPQSGLAFPRIKHYDAVIVQKVNASPELDDGTGRQFQKITTPSYQRM